MQGLLICEDNDEAALLSLVMQWVSAPLLAELPPIRPLPILAA